MHQDHQTPGHAPGFASLADVDTTERLSADDMATRREAEFLAAALLAARTPPAPVAATGLCKYCQVTCAPGALYCDEDCRADDEREQQVLRRQGRAAGRG